MEVKELVENLAKALWTSLKRWWSRSQGYADNSH
jgi:hypothetical protein